MHEPKRVLGVAWVALALLVVAGPVRAQDDAGDPNAARQAEAIGAAADEGLEDLTAPAPKTLYGAVKALWKEVHSKGGTIMIFLAVASILGLASVLERTIGLIAAAVTIRGPMDQARAMWDQGRFDDLERLAASKRGIGARLIEFVVRHRQYQVADVSAGVGDLAGRYVKRHLRRNRPLIVVATISPLLGLLGTILGMIDAFRKVNIAGAMGSAEQLSGAISLALYTTAGGLIIAIPALFSYHIIKFFTGVMADTLEGRANEMITGWLMRKEADA